MKRTLLGILMALLCFVPAAADEGPREVVAGFMDALKHRDYAKAFTFVGIDVPAPAAKMVFGLLEAQPYLIWAVKDYQIKSVKTSGGLATVTVEETQFRDLAWEARQEVARDLPDLDHGIVWGENTVMETFVLVHLDGRWQFDCGHSGVQADAFIKTLLRVRSQKSRSAATDKRALQTEGARLINSIGFGQLLQSFGSLVPVLPGLAMVGALAAPGAHEEIDDVKRCSTNLKNIGTALEMYSTDNNGRYPTVLSSLTPNYLKTIPTCPAASADSYSGAFVSISSPDAYTVVCKGTWHQAQGLPANYPQYTSTEGLRIR